MKLSVGRITQAVPSKKTYYVLLFKQSGMTSGLEVEAKEFDPGVTKPYKEEERVLCVLTKNSGWVILGRLYDAVKKQPPGLEKSKEEVLAEEQEDLLRTAVGGYEADGVPQYRKPGQEPDVYGDTVLRSETSDTMVKIKSDGSLLMVVNRILHIILSKLKNSLIIRMRELWMDIIPGFFLKIQSKDERPLPNVGSQVKAIRQKVRLETGLSSDPDDLEIDAYLEAGYITEASDTGYGLSAKAAPQKLTRGLRVRLGKFAVAEVDNKQNEIRITFPTLSPGGEVSQKPYQIRVNEGELVFAWGDQFLAFRDEGLIIKANIIGLGGPVAMWSPQDVAGFKHNVDVPDGALSPVIEWKSDAQRGEGIRFNKSVYFGSGEYLPVLEDFLTKVYSKDLAALMQHAHTSAAPGSPTSPPTVPPTAQTDWGLDLSKVQTVNAAIVADLLGGILTETI